jgi:hypothetical protein
VGSRKDLKIDFGQPEGPTFLLPPDLSTASRDRRDTAHLLKLLREHTENIDDRPLDETIADVRGYFHGLN